MSAAVFCPVCNYGLAKEVVALARIDFRCGRCGGGKLSEHYEIGSHEHVMALRDYAQNVRYVGNGVCVLPPAPRPEDQAK